jgi:membrane associated rhomboid family serine protease
MAIGSRSYARPYISGSGMPPGVKALLIANCAVFLLQFFAHGYLDGFLAYFVLTPAAVVRTLFLWQLFTYTFIHGGILHLVFNMLVVWWFGRDLEETWGTRPFLRFYFLSGALAGVCVILADYLFGNPSLSMLGSSGATYAILAATAALWPDRELLFYFLFPIKIKYFVLIVAAITFFQSYGAGGGAANIALLSGFVFGYVLVKMPRRRRVGVGMAGSVAGSVKDAYKNWKMQRAKKKFQVYLRKQGRGPWVN